MEGVGSGVGRASGSGTEKRRSVRTGGHDGDSHATQRHTYLGWWKGSPIL